MIADRTMNDGWRVSMMRDVWTTSRSAPAAIFTGDNTAFALRWRSGELDMDNRVVFYGDAAGIDPTDLIDFDDINQIITRGLRNSITR